MTAQWGEAIYIGSDKSVHSDYNPTVSFVTVRDNLIGPNVSNEGMDVKEGTHDVRTSRELDRVQIERLLSHCTMILRSLELTILFDFHADSD